MPAMYRYVALRKKLLGVDELHMYDVYVSLTKEYEQKYTYEQAIEIVKKALAVLGMIMWHCWTRAFGALGGCL